MDRERKDQGHSEERNALGRRRKDALFPVAPTRAGLPSGYAGILRDLKQRIQQERLRTVMAANAGMVLLYWDIGQTILKRQATEGWGAKVIDRLSADLRQAFPDMKGLSPRNLKYMRAFAEAWPDKAIVQRVIAQLPWRQNIALLERLDDPKVRLWYARKTAEQGWSQPILCLQIEGHAHERQGKALTNFTATLPPADSDMAAQVFKDPYLFDFIGTTDPRREREVEQALVELKAVPFDPAFVGQMNLYLSAVDDLLRHPDDKPSIGLLLCKEKNKITVEYALRDLRKPVGVAAWRTRLVESLPKLLQGQLPTIEEIEKGLGKA